MDWDRSSDCRPAYRPEMKIDSRDSCKELDKGEEIAVRRKE